MRVKVFIGSDTEGKPLKLPLDKQRFYISLMKSVFSETSSFAKVFPEKKEFSRYVFGVYLGKACKTENRMISFSSPFSITFSTGEFDIFASFCNRVLELKDEKISLPFGKEQFISFKQLQILPLKKIKDDKVVIKTLSAVVVQNHRASVDSFGDYFLTPFHKDFQDANNDILKKRMSFFGKNGFYPVYVETFGGTVKEEMIHHYGGFLKGFKGKFKISSNPETLQFIYDYGWGNRTGSGMGLVETDSKEM